MDMRGRSQQALTSRTPRPTTPHPPQAPCQHNFCLNCFKRWLAQGKKSCPNCRSGPACMVTALCQLAALLLRGC